MKIARWAPGLATVKSYKASFLPHDLAAGLTLGAVMVPVGLAYGELAGLPLAGLYGSMLPLIAYALFGSSRLLIVGLDALRHRRVRPALALPRHQPGRGAGDASGRAGAGHHGGHPDRRRLLSWHDTTHRTDAVPVPGLLVYRFSAPLFFANCSLFRDRIEALIDTAPQPVRGVVVDGGAIHDVDLMACEMLVELDRELGERGIALAFGNLRDRVRRDIERGLSLVPDADAPSYPSVAEAAQAVRARAAS